MENKILEAKKLHKTFLEAKKSLTVLKDISTKFEQGKTYAITGASGSGKSTLLHLLGGLDSPTTGSVFFDNKNIASMKKSEKELFLSQSIGFVFQFHYLVNELTVLENIILKGLIAGISREKSISRAKELLKKFGLIKKANSYPFQLSGGEQQRVSIIRAIFNKPDFLLADEPTGNLDAQNASNIVDFFIDCQKEQKMGLIICSHDKDVYSRMEKVFELKDGLLG
jgi:lipoprotein-releasing system ATP-binding protein